MKDKLYQIAVDNSRYGDWMPEAETFHQDIQSELELGLVVWGTASRRWRRASVLRPRRCSKRLHAMKASASRASIWILAKRRNIFCRREQRILGML